MKLTKTKLKEMIKEELLNESGGTSLDMIKQLEDAWSDVVYDIIDSEPLMDVPKYDKIIKDATKIFHKALGKLSKIN